MSTQNKSKAGYAYGSIICILFAIFVLGLPLSIAAVVLGVIGLSSDKPGERVVAGIGLVFGIIFAVVMVAALSMS